jgi:hypothetical protein
MSASEATASVEASAQPTRWSPGDVSKNQLNKSPQCAGYPGGGFVQLREKFGRVHEGNTGASPKSFRKLWQKISAARMRLAPTALPHRLAWGIAQGFDCRRINERWRRKSALVSGAATAETNEPAIESRFQRWWVFPCHIILGRSPRLVLSTAPLALNSKRRSGDRRSLVAIVCGNS